MLAFHSASAVSEQRVCLSLSWSLSVGRLMTRVQRAEYK